MAKLYGNNPKGYKGKYSGKAGKNPHRNPQPGFSGGGGGGGKRGAHASNEGCWEKLFGAFAILFLLGVGSITALVEFLT